MEAQTSTQGYSLRRATAADAEIIRQIIHRMNLNPMGLEWEHFILAVDSQDKIIGTGQLKPHADGTLELASIAVLPEWRGKGVARTIIERLFEQHPGRLYLTCRARQGAMYEKFGFEVVSQAEMTPYFKRLSRLINFIPRLANKPDQMLVMRRN